VLVKIDHETYVRGDTILFLEINSDSNGGYYVEVRHSSGKPVHTMIFEAFADCQLELRELARQVNEGE
jgi:hypothetical protein